MIGKGPKTQAILIEFCYAYNARIDKKSIKRKSEDESCRL